MLPNNTRQPRQISVRGHNMKISRFIDAADWLGGSLGLTPIADWRLALQRKRLYAGKLYRSLPQFSTHVGLTPFRPSSRNICHDVTQPLDLPDSCILSYQSEDVFEHVEYALLPGVLREIYRVLVPGGYLRLSLPNYECDLLLDRCRRNSAGEIYFDPGGGGAYRDGRVVDGGHVWFPTYQLVKALFDAAPFERVEYLHYSAEGGVPVLRAINYDLGHIQRTPDHDVRAQNPPRALSIVVDAYKAAERD